MGRWLDGRNNYLIAAKLVNCKSGHAWRNNVPENEKPASPLATNVGCTIAMIAGIVVGLVGAEMGGMFGYMLTPSHQENYYVAIRDALCGSGFVIGYLLGVFAANRAMVWIARRKTTQL
jgi:hypothetical protein